MGRPASVRRVSDRTGADPSLNNVMTKSDRGYTLIDVALDERRLDDDRDLVVRLMEYVRANFRRIVPGVPAGCEVDLLASGTAHNAGAIPLLGLYAPPEVAGDVPDPRGMIDAVSHWCAATPDAELRALAEATPAPTWAELQKLSVYPARSNDAGPGPKPSTAGGVEPLRHPGSTQVTAAMRARAEQVMRPDASSGTLIALATAMRDEGVDQATLYRLFAEYFVQTAPDDSLNDALGDALDVIWSGPWATGRHLFETELTDADIA